MANNETYIDVEIEINEKINHHIDVRDVMYALNQLELPQKWNQMATMLNHIDLETDTLTDDQKELINNWLKKQLVKFK